MSDPRTSLISSARQRIKNEARKQGVNPNTMYVRYGMERFLYRLGRSEYRSRYILKGAMLFFTWENVVFRQTRDLDFSSFASFDADTIEANIRDICSLSVEPDDGLIFRDDSLRIAPIRINEAYKGFRARFVWRLGNTRIASQIDIGFGDVVTPEPVDMVFPAMLDMPPARILAYPRETVVAEKFSAIISIGVGNSRVKDLYDIWVLSGNFEFDGTVLQRAVKSTFDRQRADLPLESPISLRDAFAADPGNMDMWSRFLQRAAAESSPSLSEVVARCRDFLMPLARQEAGGLSWKDGRWR